MSRIDKKLQKLKTQKKKAFTAFITAGDPNLKTTEKLVLTLEQAGADIIELGVPFSDPMADGPTIQKASERALKNHIRLKDIFQCVKNIRKVSQVPILLMGYYNPLYQYGLKRFAQDAKKSGVDGTLVVDLPVEESLELKQELAKNDMNLIYLITPTSQNSRIKFIQKHGSGFVYYVSFTGVTGASHLNPKAITKKLKPLQNNLRLPLLIGFGISKPEHVKLVSPLADGVVVGSALVSLIEKHGKNQQVFDEIKKHVKKMTKNLR